MKIPKIDGHIEFIGGWETKVIKFDNSYALCSNRDGGAIISHRSLKKAKELYIEAMEYHRKYKIFIASLNDEQIDAQNKKDIELTKKTYGESRAKIEEQKK